MTTEGGRTTLTALLSGGETTIAVTDTTAFPSSGSLLIGATTVTYTGKTGTTFTGCASTPSASNGATVKQANTDFNVDKLTILGNENMTAPVFSLTAPQ